jgi:O-methyltransferase
MTIFMKAVLTAYRNTDRKVWVVDSFAGLPDVALSLETFAWNRSDMAVSIDDVRNNFRPYALLNEQVMFVKGFFSESLPSAGIGPLSILRVDADLYTSTLDVLRNLYASLSVGGYAIFDDYQNRPDCRRAVEEFRRINAISDEIQRIDNRSIFWRRTR